MACLARWTRRRSAIGAPRSNGSRRPSWRCSDVATILVVDDSGYARRLLRQTLEPHGHTVLEAGSGMAGLEAYAVHAPDLVLLDLTMEDMGGLEVLTRVREIDPRARVIVVSADIQRSTG